MTNVFDLEQELTSQLQSTAEAGKKLDSFYETKKIVILKTQQLFTVEIFMLLRLLNVIVIFGWEINQKKFIYTTL